MKYLVSIILMSITFPAYAGWVDTSGKVEKIMTYSHSETILVTLSNQGLGIEACSNHGTFAISSTMSEEGRSRMYSMLLAAQASGRTITVATLDSGDCEPWFGAQNVYRKIARMW